MRALLLTATLALLALPNATAATALFVLPDSTTLLDVDGDVTHRVHILAGQRIVYLQSDAPTPYVITYGTSTSNTTHIGATDGVDIQALQHELAGLKAAWQHAQQDLDGMRVAYDDQQVRFDALEARQTNLTTELRNSADRSENHTQEASQAANNASLAATTAAKKADAARQSAQSITIPTTDLEPVFQRIDAQAKQTTGDRLSAIAQIFLVTGVAAILAYHAHHVYQKRTPPNKNPQPSPKTSDENEPEETEPQQEPTQQQLDAMRNAANDYLAPRRHQVAPAAGIAALRESLT